MGRRKLSAIVTFSMGISCIIDAIKSILHIFLVLSSYILLVRLVIVVLANALLGT
jgi:hypothetical protein